MITFVGTPTETGSSPFSADRSVVFPTGTTTDDIVVAVFTTANTHTLGSITGWNQISTTVTTPTTDASTSVLYRVIDGAESGGWDFTGVFAGAESGGVWCFTVRGADLESPINASAVSQNPLATAVTGPSLSTSVDGCMAIQMVCLDGVIGTATEDDSPAATELFFGDPSNSGHSGCHCQYFEQESSGPISLDTTGLASDNYNCVTFAVAPAAGDSGAPNLLGAMWLGQEITITDGTNFVFAGMQGNFIDDQNFVMGGQSGVMQSDGSFIWAGTNGKFELI